MDDSPSTWVSTGSFKRADGGVESRYGVQLLVTLEVSAVQIPPSKTWTISQHDGPNHL